MAVVHPMKTLREIVNDRFILDQFEKKYLSIEMRMRRTCVDKAHIFTSPIWLQEYNPLVHDMETIMSHISTPSAKLWFLKQYEPLEQELRKFNCQILDPLILEPLEQKYKQLVAAQTKIRNTISDKLLLEQFDAQFRTLAKNFIQASYGQKSTINVLFQNDMSFEFILLLVLQNFKVSISNNIYSTYLDEQYVDDAFGFQPIASFAEYQSDKFGTWLKISCIGE